MKSIILIAPPAAGKGTEAEQIKAKLEEAGASVEVK